VTLLATGSEVGIVLEARQRLGEGGIDAAVVSMPCFELFELQDLTYRKAVLGNGLRIAVEAASAFGWTRYVASEADVVGMKSFGASAPADELYAHFGISAEGVESLVRERLSDRSPP
jgi:transketolase